MPPRDPLYHAQTAEVEAARPWARWKARWQHWVAFWERAAAYLKTAGLVVGGALAVAKGLAEFADTRPGKWVGHKAHRIWTFYADRGVGPADQPPGNGMATLATDRVAKPKQSE
jgi:hypothetical protein